MRCILLFTLLIPTLFSQVVVPTSEVRFQVANPKPEGTIMDQVKQAEDRIKGKVFRYRAFVRADADGGLISTVLRAPVVSIIRVASLPHPNQKVSVEAITNGGSNPQGLVFISGQGATAAKHMPKVKPLAEQAFANIDKALGGVKLSPADVLTVTCYLSSVEDVAEIQELAKIRYPTAALNHMQLPLTYGRAVAECEAVARGKEPVGYVYPEGLAKSPNFTQVTGISTKRMVWSGLIPSNGCTDAAVRQMFQKLDAGLTRNGASIKNVAFSYLYPNTVDGTDLTRKVRFEFYNPAQAPASTLMGFSGFLDKNACTGVEVAAAVQ